MKVDTLELRRQIALHYHTAKSFAKEVGISSTSMYAITQGRSQPKPVTLKRICEALDVTPEQITKD